MLFKNNSFIKNIEFIDLIYDGVNLSDLGFLSAMQSKTYKRNITPSFQNQLLDVPGKDGSYFFGASLKTGSVQFSLMTDGATSKQIDELKHLLQPGKLATLSLSESPYLYYYAAIENMPTFNFVPFEYYINNNEGTITYSEVQVNNTYFPITIYKGEMTVSFILPVPIGYSDTFVVDNSEQGWSPSKWLVDSNIPTKTLLNTFTGFAPGGYYDSGTYTLTAKGGYLNSVGSTVKTRVLNSGNADANLSLQFSFYPGTFDSYWEYDKTKWQTPIIIECGNESSGIIYTGKLNQVRAFSDIEYAIDLVTEYYDDVTFWDESYGKVNVIEDLNKNLNSLNILQSQIVSIIENTGEGYFYETVSAATTALRRLIISRPTFIINTNTYQVTMTMLLSGPVTYTEDVSDSFIGTFPKVPPHAGNWYFNDVATNKISYIKITTQDGNATLIDIKILDYKYTYK